MASRPSHPLPRLLAGLLGKRWVHQPCSSGPLPQATVEDALTPRSHGLCWDRGAARVPGQRIAVEKAQLAEAQVATFRALK